MCGTNSRIKWKKWHNLKDLSDLPLADSVCRLSTLSSSSSSEEGSSLSTEDMSREARCAWAILWTAENYIIPVILKHGLYFNACNGCNITLARNCACQSTQLSVRVVSAKLWKGSLQRQTSLILCRNFFVNVTETTVMSLSSSHQTPLTKTAMLPCRSS